MHPLFLQDVAYERIRDLQRSHHPVVVKTSPLRERLARLRRRSMAPGPAADQVTIRLSTEDETWAIERLAALEARPLPVGSMLVAEVRGQIVAALPIRGGEPLANPFRPTTHVVSLLRLRREQLGRAA